MANTMDILPQLAHYFDEQLWDIAYRRLPTSLSVKLHKLSEQVVLNPYEQAELEKLLELNDQYMLLRSEALRLLKQRGYDVDGFFNPVSVNLNGQ